MSSRMVGFVRNRSVGIRSHDVWACGLKSKTTHISSDKCDRVFDVCPIMLTIMQKNQVT